MHLKETKYRACGLVVLFEKLSCKTNVEENRNANKNRITNRIEMKMIIPAVLKIKNSIDEYNERNMISKMTMVLHVSQRLWCGLE